jgi:putative exosortase-associated protein (TIGR04073 family)
MTAKLFGLLLAATVFAFSSTHAQTNQPPRSPTPIKQPTGDQNAGRKLGRGISNLLFGIVEVPNQITQTTSERGGAAGCSFGIGKGLMRWIGRELVGVYEIVTFPLPIPHGYKPIMKPEWPNEDYEP